MSGRRKDGVGAEPRALLTHIAKGLVVDHWRRCAVQDAYLAAVAHLPAPEVPSPEMRALILETLHVIDATLRTLPAKTREIFLLSQFDGLRYEAISEQLGLSLSTVKRHMKRALMGCLAHAG
ncbi:hypothetical protein G6F65_022704 [Rhizopus arrhizus]|nr:hypothetical protein G6F65_022704 [Rhizopus arrhizus]